MRLHCAEHTRKKVPPSKTQVLSLEEPAHVAELESLDVLFTAVRKQRTEMRLKGLCTPRPQQRCTWACADATFPTGKANYMLEPELPFAALWH